jgi:L-threonylcarbamoyladenylate synthase
MYPYSTNLLSRVKEHLNQGGVIAYPTESCYGLGCDPFNPQAIAQILRIKGRSKAKGLIVIASRFSQLRQLIQPLTSDEIQQLHSYWPGPYSFILPVTAKVPPILIGRHRKVAVRVTKNRYVGQLCNYLNMPLVSTSANRAGFRAVKSYRECYRQFGQEVLVLPGHTDFAKRPSTVIDWPSGKILR